MSGLLATDDIRRKELIGDVTESSSSRSHSRKTRGRWPGTTVFLLLGSLFALAMAAIGCCPALAERRYVLYTATPVLPTLTPVVPTAAPSPWLTLVGDKEPTPSAPSFGFAAWFPVPFHKVGAENVDEIRATFGKLRELGISIVFQPFLPGFTKADWKAYLDVALQQDMKVVGWVPYRTQEWGDDGFEWGMNKVFLESVKDHPALYAFFMIDEPFSARHGWTITAERLQLMYQQAKEIAPNVPVVVQFSREIMNAELGEYRPQYAFKSGMCDICVIGTREFRNYGQGNVFYSDMLLSNHAISRVVIKREDPNAEIWTMVQVFGSPNAKSSYYMPSVDELQQMIYLVLSPELQAAGELDGIIWQQWASPFEAQDPKQYTLGDPEFEALRSVVKDTARRLGLATSP